MTHCSEYARIHYLDIIGLIWRLELVTFTDGCTYTDHMWTLYHQGAFSNEP